MFIKRRGSIINASQQTVVAPVGERVLILVEQHAISVIEIGEWAIVGKRERNWERWYEAKIGIWCGNES